MAYAKKAPRTHEGYVNLVLIENVVSIERAKHEPMSFHDFARISSSNVTA